MGGLLIVFVIVALTITFNLWGRLSMLLPLGVLCACCVVGSIDDRNSLVGSKGGGLSETLKMAPLLIISVVAGLILHFPLGLSSIYIPFVGQYDIASSTCRSQLPSSPPSPTPSTSLTGLTRWQVARQP
jgi:phospho-N-acetylmuramoyl-pentapeptide-transferase